MTDDEPGDLVLIHGWGFGRRVWGAFISCLEDRWRITSLDLPGYGESEKTITLNLDQMVNVVSPKIPEGSVILAWSLGGLVATKLAAMRRDIKALVLLASSPCFLNKADWAHGVDPVDFDQIASLLNNDKAEAMQKFTGLVAMGDEHPRNTINMLCEHFGDDVPKRETLEAGLEILRKEDLRNTLANIRRPTGMIFGENDVLVKHSTAKAVKILRADVQSIEIAATGHAPFLTRPQETAKAFTRLIGKLL